MPAHSAHRGIQPNFFCEFGSIVRRQRNRRTVAFVFYSRPQVTSRWTPIRKFTEKSLPMRKYVLLTTIGLVTIPNVFAEEVCGLVNGSVLIAQDSKNTYLGKIASPYQSDSIFNEYGAYGSEYNTGSIWNEYGTFGSEYNSYSATNSYTTTPPMIIKNKQVIGYLSANKNMRGAISPNLLKALCKDEL